MCQLLKHYIEDFNKNFHYTQCIKILTYIKLLF